MASNSLSDLTVLYKYILDSSVGRPYPSISKDEQCYNKIESHFNYKSTDFIVEKEFSNASYNQQDVYYFNTDLSTTEELEMEILFNEDLDLYDIFNIQSKKSDKVIIQAFKPELLSIIEKFDTLHYNIITE